MKRSISIINTEIQLINVIEAIQHFECKDNYLVIGQFNIRPERIQKIEKMLEEPLFNQHFKKIIHLPLYLSNTNPLRFFGYVLAYIKFFFLILFSKKFDFCFFGVVTDIIVKPIVYLTQYKNNQCLLCVIDEGTRIMVDASIRIQNETLLIQQNRKKIPLFYGYFLAITRKWIYPALTYFSIYSLSLLKQDKLIKNKYHYFRQNRIPQILLEKNSVIIVGQPLYELHITTLSTYQQIIQNIIAKYEHCPIYYAPHPIETAYNQWIPRQVQLLNTQYPLELVLIANQPNAVIGFNSTVLFNYAALDQKNIYSVLLSEKEYITPPSPDQIIYTKSKLGQFGIPIVNTSLIPIQL